MSKSTKTRRLSLAAALKAAHETGAFDAAAEAANETTTEIEGGLSVTKAAKVKTPKTPRFTALDPARTAWILRNARPAVSSCLCGCGGTTKGRFQPGHDATLKESLKATIAADDGGDAEIPGTPAAAAADARAALSTFGWDTPAA